MIPNRVEPQFSFTHKQDTLFCEDVNLNELARDVGTPCYVYSKNRIQRSLNHFRKSFRQVDPRIYYAVKANSNLAVLKLFFEAGLSFDIVSGGELFRLKKIGVPLDRILFSGVGKSRNELKSVIQEPSISLTVESVEELELLAQLNRQANRTVRVGLRMIPDILAGGHPHISTGLYSHKFGIDPQHLDVCIDILKANSRLSLTGIGCHIGSQILNLDPYFAAFLRIRELADLLRDQGLQVEYLNLGGGFGVSYRDDSEFDLNRLADFLTDELQNYRLVLEPGRYLVAGAGIFLCSVLYLKQTREKRFVIVDGAMNDFLRPALYGAYHRIIPVVRRDSAKITADIVGPVCESSDLMGTDRELPEPRPGDCLAILDSGAYGFVAASNYNSRCRPPEVMVEGDQYRIIRKRETLEDLLLGECGD